MLFPLTKDSGESEANENVLCCGELETSIWQNKNVRERKEIAILKKCGGYHWAMTFRDVR